MKCPTCKDITLLMSEKNGIEIDYCPECRGIWLDRGELEKLIDAEKRYNDHHLSDRTGYRDIGYPNPQTHKQDYRSESRPHESHGYKKKKSFLEAFDFFD